VKGFHEAVRDRISSLRQRVLELEQKDYPTPASRNLLGVISDILKKIPDRLKLYEPRFTRAPEAGRRSSGWLTNLLSNLHALMFIVNETSRAKTPAALINSLRDTAREYTGSTVDLLIRPDSQGVQYGYEALDLQIRGVLQQAADFIDVRLEELARPLGEGLVVLSYPAAERNNVMLHGIFLHELGHHITYRTGIMQSVMEAHPNAPDIQGIDAEAWIWEFAADLAALRIVGPAYAFGIYQSMLSTEVLETYRETHPPSYWRMLVLLDELAAEGFLDAMPGALRTHVDGWRPDLASAGKRCEANLREEGTEELFQYVQRVLPDLVKEVRASIRAGFVSFQYEHECKPLLAQLKAFVPLNEWYDVESGQWVPASLAAILNTGWMFMLADLEEFFNAIGATDPAERERLRHRIFELIAKSVEFAQIQKDIARVHDGFAPTPAGSEAEVSG
jgi:hypothetical protein